MNAYEASGRKSTVLYIEDDPSSVQLVETLLAHHGKTRLIVAKTGEEGLRLSREREPELILLDLNLPDLDGSEVLGHLKDHERTREIPVVAVTVERQDERSGLRELGLSGYVNKPLMDIPSFLAAVERAINNSH